MNTPHLPRGPVMADVAAYHLTEEEKQRLLDPAVGGVILFRRNFENVSQLKALVQEIKAVRTPELIIAVDHEGGRVQRFIDGFTRLPAMNVLGEIWDNEGQEAACAQAEQVGWVLATELSACGIDLSFTPVLDLDWGQCAVIGNRSFHRDANIVTQLALALQKGLNKGGMKSCGKHFPGHGRASGDTHHQLALTPPLGDLKALDLKPYGPLLEQFPQASVMMGHMIVPGLGADGVPSSMNPEAYRLLRIGDYPGGVPFEGAVVTDDLSGMRGILDYAPTRDAVARAIGSGADQALWSSGADVAGIIDHVVWCVHNGYIPEARVDEAASRVQQQFIDTGV